jgi:hypothetical protein
MKRVRYVLGAAGAAPVMFGMVTPAQAATDTPTVVVPVSNCGGNKSFTIPHDGNVKGHGWYRVGIFDSATCVGTVDVSLYYTKGTLNNPFCKDASLTVRFSPTTGNLWHRAKQLCGYAGSWEKIGFAVQTSFWQGSNGAVSVCARSTYHTAYTCRRLP